MKTTAVIAGIIIIAVAGFILFGLPKGASAPQSSSLHINQNPMEPKKVVMKTSKGNIELELYPAVAPKTVENFTKLTKEGFYAGTKFHRVIPEFMIQSGDPLSKTNDPRAGTGGPGYTFADEINPRSLGISETIIKQYESQGYIYDYSLTSLPVDVGSLAMANAGPNTNGSQFFIVTYSSQPHLNGKHTVFGKVIQGTDVVRAIRQGDVLKSIELLY
jgi:peptidyl-prolyl cis-trans isomerase B (cyclophilin B)